MPTLGTRHVEADCAGYDGDKTPDHDRHKHTANAPGKLCHDERGDLDKDVEQHPRRIPTLREDAILFILKRSLERPFVRFEEKRPSAPEPTSQDLITRNGPRAANSGPGRPHGTGSREITAGVSAFLIGSSAKLWCPRSHL